MCNRSPYHGKDISTWQSITRKLVDKHPLKLDHLLQTVLSCWNCVLQTKLPSPKGGKEWLLSDLSPTPQVLGFLLESAVALVLAEEYPGKWRKGGYSEQDLVYISKPRFSIEVKTSAQGLKVFGNRSYTHTAEDAEQDGRKSRRGYFLTVNHNGTVVTLVRFGWLDEDDWTGQVSETGQQAALSDKAYEHKLLCIPGDYRREAPCSVVEKVGPSRENLLTAVGITDVGKFVDAISLPGGINGQLQDNAKTFLSGDFIC